VALCIGISPWYNADVGIGWIPRVGDELAGYRVDALIGHGAMSIVYRAEHSVLGGTVALKILSPRLSRSESFRDRFVQESQLAESIDHPNVIPIHEVGESDGVLFVAMQYQAGRNLGSLLASDGPLEPATAVSIVSQVANALQAVHETGLVHGDVKPANILIAPEPGAEPGRVYLTDVGVARLSVSEVLAEMGMFVGRANYASPEQIEGRPFDGRTDIYSLGCLIYECLAAAPVFDRESELAVIDAHLHARPTLVMALRPELPPEIDEVVSRAMAKSPDDRYANATELGSGIRAVLGDRGAQSAVTGLGRGDSEVLAAG